MNTQELDKMTSEAFGATPTAMSGSIRETIQYLDGRGLLNASAVKVDPGEIKSGDWIAYFDDGIPSELYQASRAGDDNLNYAGIGAEFYRVDRSIFGKSKPEIKVEDLEPGTRFEANLLNRERAVYVRLRGSEVLSVTNGSNILWNAVNDQFKKIEVLD